MGDRTLIDGAFPYGYTYSNAVRPTLSRCYTLPLLDPAFGLGRGLGRGLNCVTMGRLGVGRIVGRRVGLVAPDAAPLDDDFGDPMVMVGRLVLDWRRGVGRLVVFAITIGGFDVWFGGQIGGGW
jgi:hypothetical protein